MKENKIPLPLRSPFIRDSLDDMNARNNIRDDLCSYIGNMKDQNLSAFTYAVIRDGQGSPTQREALLRLWTLPNARFDAWNYSANVDFTEDEYHCLEDLVKDGDGFVRKAVMLKLLTRDPAGLKRSVQRLIADENRLRREAGFELLAIMSKRRQTDSYRDIFRECDRIARAAPEAARYAELLEAYAAGGYGLCAP